MSAFDPKRTWHQTCFWLGLIANDPSRTLHHIAGLPTWKLLERIYAAFCSAARGAGIAGRRNVTVVPVPSVLATSSPPPIRRDAQTMDRR